MSPAATAKTVSDVGSAALEMSGKLSISPEVAAADLDRQSALTKYAADVAAREPATLAEAYLDQGAGKLIILKTPGLADAVPNALASNVVFAAARFSWSQLISVQERVTTAARSDRRDVTTYLDARANTVVVQLRHLAEAAIGNLHRAIETSPAGSVRAEATWTPSYEATSVCNGAYCADGIMRGGFEIQSPEANQPGYVVICSAGFVANDSSGRPSLVTAGHCMPPSVSTGSWTDDQGVSVGVSDHYAYGGYYDAGDINMAGTTYAITLDPWILDYSYVTPQGCYVNCTTVSEDDQFVVTGTASAGQYVQGVYLCKDGRTTYHTCGSIDQLNVSENVCASQVPLTAPR